MAIFLLARLMKRDRKMERDWKYSTMVTYTLGNISKVRLKDMGSTTGKVEHFIEVTSYRVCDTAKVYG